MSTTNSNHGNRNKRLSVDEQLNVFLNHFVSFVFNENQIRVTKSQKKENTNFMRKIWGKKVTKRANKLKLFKIFRAYVLFVLGAYIPLVPIHFFVILFHVFDCVITDKRDN